MSVPNTAVATRRTTAPFVRDAGPADYPVIRDVAIAAHRQYAELIAPDVYSPYLADLPGAGPMTAADVRAYADGKLARFKIPRYVRTVEEFPMTASGKVRKVDMRKAAIDMLGLTGAAASQYA
jgi:acyl-CoA synthetase (AMP-forming)/AMP-acid ligase II